MSPLRRIAFGNRWWTTLGWLCIAVPGMAQTSQVDRAQLFRANAPLGPLVPAALSPAELEYAPHSENDADLGTQRILQEIEEYKAWTVQLGLPIYYTSNVALVRNGEQSDAVFSPGMGVRPELRKRFTLNSAFSSNFLSTLSSTNLISQASMPLQAWHTTCRSFITSVCERAMISTGLRTTILISSSPIISS
jgi:hypothetical protein